MDACTNPDILKVILFIKEILRIILFIAPIGLIVMLGIDFFKNVAASKEDEMKKNVSIAIKRIIYAVVLFLILPIVNFVMSIIGGLGDNYADCYNNAEKEIIEGFAEDQAQIAINTLLLNPTRKNLINAQNAVEKINDKTTKESLNSTIKNIEQTIIEDEKNNNPKDELPKEGSNETQSSETTETEHINSGIEGTYFAPVQKTGLYFYGSPIPHDIGATEGSALYAGMDGEAVFMQWTTTQSGKTVLASYGNVITLTASNGTYIIYAHLKSFGVGVSTTVNQTCKYPCSASDYTINKKEVGRKNVKKGDVIGYTGNTGNSTGPHLHVEIYERGQNRVTDLDKAFGYK